MAPPKRPGFSDMPETDAMPVPHRRVDVDVLRDVLAAVRERRAIEIFYQSMNPEPPRADMAMDHAPRFRQ